MPSPTRKQNDTITAAAAAAAATAAAAAAATATKTNTTTGGECAVCGKPSSLRCAQCRNPWYCGRDCQKKHWKQHKPFCFPPNSTCTRCLKAFLADAGIGIRSDNDDSAAADDAEDAETCCRVPHPEHLLQDAGKCFGGGQATTLNMVCKACDQSFSMSQQQDTKEVEWTFKPVCAAWCYQGPHTIKPLPPSDERRICHDIAVLRAQESDTTESLQAQIQQMDTAKVRILVIKSAAGCFLDEDAVKPILELEMPLLEQAILLDVPFARIVFNAAKTPKLKKIELQNIPDNCHFKIKCPLLEEFDGRHHHGDCQWVQEMLQEATRLKIFKSYKLGVEEITFASTELQEIHLHRADCLEHVSIWAPRLQYLRMQGCYSLEKINFPQNHPTLSKTLPRGFRPTPFHVETTNSCLSGSAIRSLERHPLALWDGDEEDRTAGLGGSGMEAMFRRMHEGRF